MQTMNYPQLDAQRRKIATQHGRLVLWKLRDMRRSATRPRTQRLPKEERALNSLLAGVGEARKDGRVSVALEARETKERLEARGGRARTSRRRRAR